MDLALLVPLADVREDLGLGERAGGVADEPVLLGERKVDHGCKPLVTAGQVAGMGSVRRLDALAILPPRTVVAAAFRAGHRGGACRSDHRRPRPSSAREPAATTSHAGVEPVDVALGARAARARDDRRDRDQRQRPAVVPAPVEARVDAAGRRVRSRLDRPVPADGRRRGARRAGSARRDGSRPAASDLALGLFGGQLVLNLAVVGRVLRAPAGPRSRCVEIAVLARRPWSRRSSRSPGSGSRPPCCCSRYLAWTSFAAVLTAAIARRNPRA